MVLSIFRTILSILRIKLYYMPPGVRILILVVALGSTKWVGNWDRVDLGMCFWLIMFKRVRSMP